MPKTEGAGTVYTGGPGNSKRGPLYVKCPPVAGQPAGSFTYQQYMDAAGTWALQIAQLTVPAANVLTLFSAPLSLGTLNALLGAPTAGSMIQVDFIIAELKFNSTAYTAGDPVSVTYGATGPAAHATAMPAALFTAGANEIWASAGLLTTQETSASVVGVGLYLTGATQNFATGNSPLFLTIGYRILQGF